MSRSRVAVVVVVGGLAIALGLAGFMFASLKMATIGVAGTIFALALLIPRTSAPGSTVSVAATAALAGASASGFSTRPSSIPRIAPTSGPSVASVANSSGPSSAAKGCASSDSNPTPPAAQQADPANTPAPVAAPSPAPHAATSPHAEPAPTRPSFVRTPSDLECPSVLHALFASVEAVGQPAAAHLWLEDSGSATLRLVHSLGPMAPDPTPIPNDAGALGTAVRTGTAQLLELSGRVEVHGALWRYAMPLRAEDAVGVAAVDFRADGHPDGDKLSEIAVAIRGALSGCLALHVARAQTETAHLLLDLARDLSRRLDPADILQIALSRAMALSGAATGSIMLFDEGTQRLRIAHAKGLPASVVADTEVASGEGIAGWVMASGQPLLVEDLPKRGPGSTRHGVRFAVCAPIGDEDGLLGVLNVGSRQFPARFTQAHMQAIETIGKQTAVAYRNALAVESVRGVYFDSLRALALAMETKDPFATGGTARVVEYALGLGRELGLSEPDLQALEVAALLHDVGMAAACPSLVAPTSRPLSTVERGLLKMHPVLAAEIVEQAPALRGIVPIVYHHHEWYDGHGYVGGLSGESIPLGARILAVADAYVAMTSDRPYRAAMGHDDAIRELRRNAGTQFDPRVVAAFEFVFGSRPVGAQARGI